MKFKKEELVVVIDCFLKYKGFSQEDMSNSDWGRYMKRATELLRRTMGNQEIVCQAIEWVSQQEYCDWTLETVDKKWLDFKKQYNDNRQFKEMEGLLNG